MLINSPFAHTGRSAAALPLHNLPKILIPLAQFLQNENPRWLKACAPCHIFMTDYLKRGSLTVISALTFTECLCGTERHERERGRVEVNGFPVSFWWGRFWYIYLWLLRAAHATRCTWARFNAKLCSVNLTRHVLQKCSFNFNIQVWNASNIHAPVAFLVFDFKIKNKSIICRRRQTCSDYELSPWEARSDWMGWRREQVKECQVVAFQRMGQVKLAMLIRTQRLRDSSHGKEGSFL